MSACHQCGKDTDTIYEVQGYNATYDFCEQCFNDPQPVTAPREEDVEALRQRALNERLQGWERAQAVNALADKATRLQREVDERLRVNVGLVAENSELKKKVGR